MQVSITCRFIFFYLSFLTTSGGVRIHGETGIESVK